jgi:hypothetical protein
MTLVRFVQLRLRGLVLIRDPFGHWHDGRRRPSGLIKAHGDLLWDLRADLRQLS